MNISYNPMHYMQIGCLLMIVSTLLSGCILQDNMRPDTYDLIQPNHLGTEISNISSRAMMQSTQNAKNKQNMSANNSLWGHNQVGFFQQNRAQKPGDILTVMVSIDDKAKMNNSTDSQQNNNSSMSIDDFLGITNVLPGIKFTPKIGAKRSMKSSGKSSLNRGENITLKIAATILEVLPNGNLLIYGRQQVRVNYQLRDLQISGIVRAQDISAENSIEHTKLAEARISYGGGGYPERVHNVPYGSQLMQVISPF